MQLRLAISISALLPHPQAAECTACVATTPRDWRCCDWVVSDYTGGLDYTGSSPCSQPASGNFGSAVMSRTRFSRISPLAGRIGAQSQVGARHAADGAGQFATRLVAPRLPDNVFRGERSHAGLHHRHRRSRTAGEERISGCGELYWRVAVAISG